MPELQAILDKHPVMEALLSDVLTPEGKRGKLMQKLSDEIEIAENKKKDDLEPNVINKDDELWVPSGHPDADLNRPAMYSASGIDPVLYHRVLCYAISFRGELYCLSLWGSCIQNPIPLQAG